MKKALFLIIFLFFSCGKKNIDKDINDNLNFSDKISFEVFELKLNEYAENEPYPDLSN
tara:strand:+ start:1616 stop:1789 length:174 start_codon:yes stop_codon:yes gene_type:complete